MQLSVNSGPILPDEIQSLFVRPTLALAVSLQDVVCTLVPTIAHTTRWPMVVADPATAYLSEAEEFSPSQAVLDEVDVTPRKIGGLVKVSNEVFSDSNPAASGVIGDGLARDTAYRLDLAFFTEQGVKAPHGLGSLSGHSAVEAPAQWENLDPMAEAVAVAEGVGATVTAFITSPADVLALDTLKTATGSNAALLAVDPTQPSRRTVIGRPVLSSAHVPEGTVWAVDASRIVCAMREDTRIDVSDQAYFGSDVTAVRSVLRADWGVLHPASVVKITCATS